MIRRLYVAVILLGFVLAAVPSATASVAIGPDHTWPPGPARELTAVSVDSPTDAWAIGLVYKVRPIVRHWNGASWVDVPIQMPADGTVELHGVHAFSPADVWIVGDFGDPGRSTATFTEHWDGTAFTIVPSPSPDPLDNLLEGVSGAAPNDVWAVGETGSVTLTEHWDGTDWSVVPNPGGLNSRLNAVVTIATDDVWAGGNDIDHWDGQQWTVVTKLDFGYLWFLSADSPTDIWGTGFNNQRFGFIERSNGHSWSTVYQQELYGSGLEGVYPIAPNDVWVSGASVNRSELEFPIMLRWHGGRWHHVSVPNPGAHLGGAWFNDIDGSGPDDIWAVGLYFAHRHGLEVGHPLIEHFDGTQWTVFGGTAPTR